jgi:hypothetical protein
MEMTMEKIKEMMADLKAQQKEVRLAEKEAAKVVAMQKDLNKLSRLFTTPAFAHVCEQLSTELYGLTPATFIDKFPYVEDKAV